MPLSLRSILLGTKASTHHPYSVLMVAVGVFVLTLLAYAVGFFTVSGGVIWIPFYAAVVGMIAGFWVGYARRGMLFGWLVTYTALLGYHANSAFIGQSRQGLLEQFRYFTRIDGLGYLAVVALVLGTLVFTLGTLMRWGIESFNRELGS